MSQGRVDSESLNSASLGVTRRVRSRVKRSSEYGDSASHRVDSASRVSQGLTLTLSLTKDLTSCLPGVFW